MNLIRNKGQSILEVIVALAIFSLIASAMVSLAAGSFTSLGYGADLIEANNLANQGLESVRSIQMRGWNEGVYNSSSVSLNSGVWIYDGEGTTETIGKFTRVISFEEVCRDSSDEIVECPSTYSDPHTKKVVVDVSWDRTDLITNNVIREAYITNWRSKEWTQSTWTGGDGQDIWSDSSKYDLQDGNLETTLFPGELRLKNGELLDSGFETEAGSESYDWNFDLSSEYIYDSNEIEVSLGEARLVEMVGGSGSGDTLNPGFDPDSSNWTYSDWIDSGNRVTGSRISSGGNPNGYVNIVVGKVKSQTRSGYWSQPFTTTIDNPDTVNVNFDWSVIEYSPGFVSSYKVYVFVDQVNGLPTLGDQVWESEEITGTTSWTSVSDLDVSSAVNSSGTYYLKVAARVVTTGGGGAATGQNVAGFDNVSLHWEGAGVSYSTNIPTIYPTNQFETSGSGTWSSFTETAIKNGGEIYYQLSDDAGVTWQYWDGASWSVAGDGNYNIADVVNTNISSFNSGNQQILWKAFLESDGTAQVILDTINISSEQSGSPWSYDVWDIGPGETDPVGGHLSVGGNPNGYNEVEISGGPNNTVGGYWVQSFENFTNNPIPVTLNFDYLVSQFVGSPNSVEVRVYVDSSLGDPVNQVGSSIPITNTQSWTQASEYDLSSDVNSSGVYYLKMAVWADTGAGGIIGPFAVGFDNVVLDLGNGAYPSGGVLTSSGFDAGASSAFQVIEWSESAPSENEEIIFEVSTAPDNAGEPGTWSDWYGENGSGTNFTNASGTVISLDLNDNNWVRYRVTFSGNGSDTPVLNDITVNYKDE